MKIKETLLLICLFCSKIVTAQLTLNNRPRNTFDTELYNSVLDTELCEREVDYIKSDAIALAKFLDAGFRIPRNVFSPYTSDYGAYHECLKIKDGTTELSIEGKYCFITVPMGQNLSLPFNSPVEEERHSTSNMIYDSFFKKYKSERSGATSPLSGQVYSMGLCVPKSCTTQQWMSNLLFNVTRFGFQYDEVFCRLPNDKPFVAADYIAIVVFSILGILTVLSTGYDLYYNRKLQKDSKGSNVYLRMFSVYTNGRRLMTFTKSSNALECLDGIRSLLMMWVIICHTYSAYNNLQNTTDVILMSVSCFQLLTQLEYARKIFSFNIFKVFKWLTSFNAVWISTGLYAVDSFFFMSGLLLVYTTVGKMTEVKLLKNIHLFYLNRLFRVLPLLAATVLLQASVLHHIGDGPYWVEVANLTERCRHFWWSTLLNVQNYVNPNFECISHSWYIAIDMQLHIISPLVLFWILTGSRTSSWAALIISNLIVLAAASVFNFSLNMQSITASLTRMSETSYYLKNYYVNTLTRAAPFFVGLVFGYILSIWKGKKVKLNKIVVLAGWLLSVAIIGLCTYLSFRTMELDWDNQTVDNMINSFGRAGWTLAVGWIILACVKGYGGPLNWFFSLQMWKLPARISYAMYLCHYPIQFVITGMEVTPTYFTVWNKFFEFLAVLLLSFIVAYVMTLTIDAPFSILIKLMLQGNGGSRKVQKPQTENTVVLNPPANYSTKI